MKAVLAAVLLAAAAAAPAAYAIRPCDTTDIQCHKTCTLPHVDKEHGVYWYYC